MKIAGVDFSLNSTGICILDTDTSGYTFYNVYRKLPKKTQKILNSINVQLINHQKIKNNDEIVKIKDGIELTDTIFNIIRTCNFVGIEGFAFNARGNRLVEIAGYQYLLREKLIINGIPFQIYPPTTIKKFAGNGRFNKEEMISVFKGENITLSEQYKYLDIKAKKPFDDIVDSYYICKKVLNDKEIGLIKYF